MCRGGVCGQYGAEQLDKRAAGLSLAVGVRGDGHRKEQPRGSWILSEQCTLACF